MWQIFRYKNSLANLEATESCEFHTGVVSIIQNDLRRAKIAEAAGPSFCHLISTKAMVIRMTMMPLHTSQHSGLLKSNGDVTQTILRHKCVLLLFMLDFKWVNPLTRRHSWKKKCLGTSTFYFLRMLTGEVINPYKIRTWNNALTSQVDIT